MSFELISGVVLLIITALVVLRLERRGRDSLIDSAILSVTDDRLPVSNIKPGLSEIYALVWSR